mmetsp:Transcript_25183/g.56843  ORF Transcript_25183/g.56843 Transcript_25183/m.56843 type:complete len:229 (+) Transcript_25183:270-956(+)
MKMDSTTSHRADKGMIQATSGSCCEAKDCTISLLVMTVGIHVLPSMTIAAPVIPSEVLTAITLIDTLRACTSFETLFVAFHSASNVATSVCPATDIGHHSTDKSDQHCRTISELATAAEPNVDAMRVVAVKENCSTSFLNVRAPPGAQRSRKRLRSGNRQKSLRRSLLCWMRRKVRAKQLQYRESESASPAPATPSPILKRKMYPMQTLHRLLRTFPTSGVVRSLYPR